MTLAPATTIHTWTREEYYRMADMGLFAGKRVELIAGQVVDMAPMRSPHAVAITLAVKALRAAFDTGVVVRGQLPFLAGDNSEPEPDLAVVEGKERDYIAEHPTEALLLVEVAESSLDYDRETKSSLYARSGVAEYWIVNLVDNQVEVFRQPVQDAEQPFGFGYQQQTIVKRSSSLTVLARPQIKVEVSDLLP